MMFVPHFLLDWSWNETFYRAMILLVVASPCALVRHYTATLSAISNGARNGILFKGGIHLERLASVRAIAFDKTGTLTEGKPTVTDVCSRKYNRKEYFLLQHPLKVTLHPLAESIVKYAQHAYDITLKT